MTETRRDRFAFRPFSEHQAQILEQWAELEGVSVSGLCAKLVDLGLAAALQQGTMPQVVVNNLRNPN